ncbi:hypothetical protein T484DRAFT_3599175 [Baffinella frigidus]|nr:hypothetical protein T484DRAFT_3599175 [Cryptophyta sp. CCMP2293]
MYWRTPPAQATRGTQALPPHPARPAVQPGLAAARPGPRLPWGARPPTDLPHSPPRRLPVISRHGRGTSWRRRRTRPRPTGGARRRTRTRARPGRRGRRWAGRGRGGARGGGRGVRS